MLMVILQKKLQTENENKRVVYGSILSSQYNAIAAADNFNQITICGVCHPTGVQLFVFISSNVSGLGDSQWRSSNDACPSTTSPINITYLQVSMGGVNQLQSTLLSIKNVQNN